MKEWRQHAEGGDWQHVEWERLPEDDLRELYQRLCAVVPKVVREDGVERHEDYALPQDADRQLKHAALILNEIRGQFEEDPAWTDLAEDYAFEVLKEIGKPAERAALPIKPDKAEYLSREWHALRVLELVEDVRFTMVACEPHPEDSEILTVEVMQSWMEEMGAIAFAAGRHFQAAWGKEFELHALRGMKTIAGSKTGGEITSGKMAPRTKAVIAEMKRLMSTGLGPSEAAFRAAKNGFGASPAANRKVWSRYKKNL